MKRIICFIVTVFIATLIVGCGSSKDSVKSNPFAKYAERPVTSEFYQRYFVNEYCKEANNFTKEYQEFLEKVGTKQFKMQIVRPESSLFYKKVTWNIADRDDSNPDAARYRYLGEIKDGKPHGVGMLYTYLLKLKCIMLRQLKLAFKLMSIRQYRNMMRKIFCHLIIL